MPPLYRRISLRLLPILFCCYLANYIDRVNVSFAKTHIAASLGLSDTAYGLGAGLFFVGYFFFQVPSNLLLDRIGARRAITLIILLWGVISAGGAFVRSEEQFYAQRLVLGAAEAGFFPGVILYLTRWYPSALRARIFALFLTAIPVAGLIGGPLSGLILEHVHGGLESWQWLFILEGLPGLLLAAWVWRCLPDQPVDARWLSPAERSQLEADLRDDAARAHPTAPPGESTLRSLLHPLVAQLCLLYFCTMMGLYGLSFWIPQIIRGLGWQGDLRVGLLSAIPWGIAVVFMIYLGGRSDRRGERRRHAAFAGVLAALGFALCGWLDTGLAGLAAVALAASGVMGLMAVQWSLPGALLRGTAAAAGIALVNSFGNLGGFVSPFVLGKLSEATGTARWGLLLTAASLALAATLLLLNPKLEPRTQRPS